MDTLMNWIAFGVLIYIVGVKARWWSGPITVLRRRRENARRDVESAGSASTPVTLRGTTVDARETRTGPGRDTEADNSQDTDLDTRHDTNAPGLWTRLREAVDLVIHPDGSYDDDETDGGVVPDPPSGSPSVTTGEAPPPRVVVQYVPHGAWTGNVSALDADGIPVILQYRTRSELAAPPPDLAGPDDDDSGDASEIASIDEVALRQDWLRAIEADGRFSNAEIVQMYREKWGRGRRTLDRDRAALAEGPAPRSGTSR